MDASNHIEFMLNNSKKCLFRNTKRAVTEQLHEQTALFLTKQDKLKSMLTNEENFLKEEISISRERIKAATIEMRRIKAQEIECAARGQKRRDALERMEALHRDNSENLRIQESIQKHIAAVAGIKYQIEEKHKNDLREKELDIVWTEVMDQYYKTKCEDEEAKEKERESLKIFYRAVLQEQVAERDKIKMEELKEVFEDAQKIKESVNEFDREEKEKLQKQIEQKHDLAKNKYEDLIQFRAQREKEKMEEKRFVNIYLANQLNGLEDEEAEINRKKFATRLELDLHREDLNKVKDEMKKIEILEEELRKKEMSLIERKCQQEEIKERITRNKLEQEIMKMRMVQLAEKRDNY